MTAVDYTALAHGRRKRAARIESDMAFIPLTRGQVAVVDIVDADLSRRCWKALKARSSWYAARGSILLHRVMWFARISVCGRTICLGYHDSVEAASAAYAAGARKHHGEFARVTSGKPAGDP